MGKAAMAGSIAGIGGHFTPIITGEDAATKAGLGVAAASSTMKVLSKGFKMKQSAMIEIPLTVAGIMAANHFVNEKHHLDAFDWFFF